MKNPFSKFLIGVNYWPRHQVVYMWKEWDPEKVDQELAQISNLGLNTVRFFLVWEDFQPVKEFFGYRKKGNPRRTIVKEEGLESVDQNPWLVDKKAISKLDEFIRLAAKHNIGLIPTIFVGWMGGTSFVPPIDVRRNFFTDPTSLKYQVLLCEYLAKHYQDEKTILAWDLGNEQNCYDQVESLDAGWVWTRLLANTLKANDPNHSVTSGMCGLVTHRGPGTESGVFHIKDVADSTDFTNVHTYAAHSPHICIDEPLDIRTTLHPTWILRQHEGVGDKPVLLEEYGSLGPEFMSDEMAAASAERVLYSNLLNGAMGVLWWVFTEYTSPERLPYAGFMAGAHGMGMFQRDGKPKPVAEVFQNFAATVSKIDFSDLVRQQPDGGIVLPWQQTHDKQAFTAFVLARQANLDLDIILGCQPFEDYKILVLPSISGHEAYYYTDWLRIEEFVRNGGVVYLSMDNAIICHSDSFFGVKVLNRKKVSGSGNIRFVQDFGPLNKGDVIEYTAAEGWLEKVQPISAEVLAETDDGLPAITVNKFGKGYTVLCQVPLERGLTNRPDVMTTDTTHLLYRGLKQLACVQSLVVRDDPLVESGLIVSNDHRYLVVVNHSNVDRKVEIEMTMPAESLFSLRDGKERLLNGGKTCLTLGGNRGDVFEISGGQKK